MYYIKSDELLRQFIPNTITTVKGETPLFEKLSPFLATAEAWLSETIVGNELFALIAEEAISEKYNIICQIIAYEGFRNAIPSLDLILTPNGFGIVSNSNIAPASSERVTRLADSLESLRDKGIQILISKLAKDAAWIETAQAQFFRATLFPDLSVMRSLLVTKSVWEAYLATRNELMAIEEKLVDSFFGGDMLEVLRKEAQTEQYRSLKHITVIKKLRFVVLRILQASKNDRPFDPYMSLSSVVEIMKADEEDFHEWHESFAKALFTPPVFKNSKEAKGYWF